MELKQAGSDRGEDVIDQVRADPGLVERVLRNLALWDKRDNRLMMLSGGMKLVLPIAELTQDMPMPGLFLHFIGVCEMLGAFGLILPGLLRIRPGLTPLAAAGLVIIMIGATAITLHTTDMMEVAMALYERMGFRPTGRTGVMPHEPSVTEFEMTQRYLASVLRRVAPGRDPPGPELAPQGRA